MNSCLTEGCARPVVAKARCGTCYRRYNRQTNTELRTRDLLAQKRWRQKGNYFDREECRIKRANRLAQRKKDPKMFLTLRYEGLKARVNSKNSAKSHLYYGKEIMPKQTFIDLYLKNDSFLALFKQWQESGFLLKLTPTPDRKDSKLGYIQSNIEWVTHSENSRRGSLSAWGKV